MLGKRLNKYLIALVLVMVTTALSLGIVLVGQKQSTARAATRYMSVEKVFLPDSSAVSDPSVLRHIQETGTSIANNDFVIMNTTQQQYIDSQNQTHTGREAILIHFPGTSTSRGIPTVSIWYNNNLLKINQVVELDDDLGQPSGVSTFTQYLHVLTPAEVASEGLDASYTTKYSDGSSVELPEGKYRVYLQYFDINQGPMVEEIEFYLTTQKTYNQVNENPTLSDTEKLDAIFDTTNSTLNVYNQMTASVNYFNFNNCETTHYSAQQQNFIKGRTNPSELYYPTLYYNPEKFSVTFSRTLYNYRESTTLDFAVYLTNVGGVPSEIGYLTARTTTTTNPTNVITRVYEVERGANGFEIKIQFDQVGEYQITKTPRLRVGYTGSQVNYVTPTSNIITANEEYLVPLALTINGYVANYSNTNTTSAPLYNDTYSYNTMADQQNINKVNDVVYAHDMLIASANESLSVLPRTRAETIYTADMTFNNTSLVSNNSSEIISMATLRDNIKASIPEATDSTAFSYFFEYIASTNFIKQSHNASTANGTIYTLRPSTNLAPVTFDFYGKLYTGTASNYASWYAYRDTSDVVSVNRYTRGMQFESAGEYVVYVTYENVAFSSNNQAGSSRQHQYMHQVFCFEITNATPSITVYAQNDGTTPTILSSETAEQLSTNAYTNKYVYATWETAGPFDASIYCTYNIYDWDGEIIRSNIPLNGLVYQQNKGAKYAISATPTLLFGSYKQINQQNGQDGYYQIQVFRSNNSKAYVNYPFSIDTAPINGIKSLQVIGKKLARDIGSDEPTVLSELDYSKPDAFNLITNMAFGFTWNDKQSGAPITAQYIYASITKSTNYDLVKAITGSNTATELDAQNILLNMAGSGAVYMPTNATLGVLTPAMKYTKIKTDTLEDINATLSDSQIINTPQLAYLLLRDAAGNTAIYATILDNTNTQVLQVEKQSSYVNVITKNTKFYWGTHKSISAEQSTVDKTNDPNLMRDVYDFANSYNPTNNTYSWVLNGYTYSTSTIISRAFYAMDIPTARALVLPIDKIEIAAQDDKNEYCEPGTKNGAAINWYAEITVEPGATSTDPYSTRVKIDEQPNDNVHILETGEFRYQITVWDEAQNSNAGGLSVEVNLDKSLGSLRSYYEFDGSDLSYNRVSQNGPITDRQYVGNTYSTDRRYIAFSWTEPGSGFSIDTITLEYYPFAGNPMSTNYPYGDTPTVIELYSASKGTSHIYEDGGLYTIQKAGAGGAITTYYQTSVLKKLPYAAEFGGTASEAGKYVITRKYKIDDNQDLSLLEGDSIQKTYTYYLDRKPILPTDNYNYGDEKIQFGYNKGDYTNYPDYPASGKIVFDNYGLLSNTEGFDKLSLNTANINSVTPSNIITQSNVLPAGVTMSTWSDGGYTVYDKYYTDPQAACDNIIEVLNNYKNSTRLQVAVQFFANNATSQYALTSQTFYSTKTPAASIVDPSAKNLYSRPLSDLQFAFTEIGRYRVVLFDLANFDGLLSGNAYTDFSKIAINLSGDNTTTVNTLFPNCSIVSFELVGKAPAFNYQVGMDSYASVNNTLSETITNEAKARLTWEDPNDEYSAEIAYNDISIIKNTIPKGNNTSSVVTAPTELKQYFKLPITTQTGVFSKPVEITCSEVIKQSLVDSGSVCVELTNDLINAITQNGYHSLKAFIEEKTALPTDPVTYAPFFLYVTTEYQLNTIINNGISTTNLNQVEYYKVRKSDTSKNYTYYLLLPKSEVEDLTKNEDKLADTRYIVQMHYIAKNSTDYLEEHYLTTKELYIDNTAPYYNLVDLITNDSYIDSLGTTFKSNLITNIDNPDSTFLKSYAFAVSPGFSLQYRNKYESNTYFYYRERNNYTGAKDEQVVITDDARYPAAPRFDKNSNEYVLGSYSGLVNIVPTVFDNPGYYDIIEQDQAGNLRVYTIFVSNDAFSLTATNNGQTIELDNTNIDGKIYHSAKQTETDNLGFELVDLISMDMWIHIKIDNLMSGTDSLEYYYLPEDAIADIDYENASSNIYEIIYAINDFILNTAIKYQDQFGSQLCMTITNRLNATNSHSFYINTQGQLLINTEQDFLSLITINNQTGQFNLRLPNTTNIPSTKLNDLKVFMIESDRNTMQIFYDVNYIPLPTTQSEFESDRSINQGYAFTLANNIVYKFEFVDNFGRKTAYSYPIDSSLIKRIEYTGNTTQYKHNGTTYTYTSNDVNFVYQATGLYVAITITDLDNDKILYQKDVSDLYDTDNELFTYTRDSLASNIITVTFNAIRGIHNHVHIEVNSGTDTITAFDFVIYSYLPQIILSDTAGSPIQNYITSKEVMMTWTTIEGAMFNPFVQLVYPDGSTQTITSGFVVSAEGDYIVRAINDMGIYNNGIVKFTIKEYIVSIYGVYQLTNDGQVQLSAFADNYLYTTPQGQMSISQYMFLSNDSNWDRNITIYCNEDKDLKYEVIETFGNTRVYRVYGEYLYHIEIYFAVTRIPSLNVATYTNFRIDGDSTLRTSEFKTTSSTITWQTTYTDSTAEGRTVVYPKFFTLDLYYNGTFVGSYTNGSITLTNSGIYTISIHDPVGQKQYFGSNASTSNFELTILTSVIYYINNNAAIPYATYSDPVDVYIPNLSYYDFAPKVTFYRNNATYTISPNAQGHYIFSTPGAYKIEMSSTIEHIIGQVPEANLSATYQFVIVSPNEAIQKYDFTPMPGYEIIKVLRIDSNTDITQDIKNANETSSITSLHIDADNYGVGKYEITVRVAADGYNPSQTYSYSIWINNESVILTPSRAWGSSSTAGFEITVNTASIYERIGECMVTVNGKTLLAINDSNKNSINPTTITGGTEQGEYIVQLVSASGKILQSYRMTINEPFNTAAIILIVIAVVVVIGLGVLFFLMRHRVKVR